MKQIFRSIARFGEAGLALALLCPLTGCGGFNGANDVISVDRSHPITVQSDVSTVMIQAPRDKAALTTEDRQTVDNFIRGYKDRGHGSLTVSTPSGSTNETAALAVMSELHDIFAEQGIGSNKIDYTPYPASGADASAPVILSYKLYVATPSSCGDWSMDFAHDPNNAQPPNYGCATQNNLAAMVADPADLVTPRETTPADAERRAVVFAHYRKGEPTATPRTDQDSAAVSEVNK